jgi:hypothetical protein
MKDYLNEINEKHPIRRTKEQKEQFFNYLCNEFEPDTVRKDVLENKHENLVIGDIERAEIILTAHYDTPATALYPNLMMPANPALNMLYHILIPLLLALLSLAVACLIVAISAVPEDKVNSVLIPCYLLIYFLSFYLSTRCFTNKNNKNDNTSGVATLVSIAKSVEKKDKVAFVFFDNEEKGLLGSKAMAKKYKNELKNKLVINFDCVGNGREILIMAKKGVLNNENYIKLLKTLKQENGFNLYFLSLEKCSSNSDHKNFENGVGVVACQKGKIAKFITGKIHTNKDTIADKENIEYLTSQMIKYLSV